MGIELKGTRIYADDDGFLSAAAMRRPGAFGRADPAGLKEHSNLRWWQVTAPDGSMGCLDPNIHQVVEHEDGTISVTPSIDFSKRAPGRFHGYLKNGVWKSC